MKTNNPVKYLLYTAVVASTQEVFMYGTAGNGTGEEHKQLLEEGSHDKMT